MKIVVVFVACLIRDRKKCVVLIKKQKFITFSENLEGQDYFILKIISNRWSIKKLALLWLTFKEQTVPLRPGHHTVQFVWTQPNPLITLIDEVHFPDSNPLQITVLFAHTSAIQIIHQASDCFKIYLTGKISISLQDPTSESALQLQKTNYCHCWANCYWI